MTHAVSGARTVCGKGTPGKPVPWPSVTCGRCKKSDPSRRRICKRGHVNNFDRANRCRSCNRLWSAENRWKYAEKRKEYYRAAYRKNGEKIRAQNRAWRERNKERDKAVSRLRWYKSKPNPTESDIRLIISIRQRYPYRKPAVL